MSDWQLHIAGIGEEEIMLKKMAVDYKVSDSVVFLGQQKNMEELYRKASFFCMSSRFEGLPMVLLECQSFGIPVVSFDCETGPSEIIMHNWNGKLALDSNVDDLTLKIIEL